MSDVFSHREPSGSASRLATTAQPYTLVREPWRLIMRLLWGVAAMLVLGLYLTVTLDALLGSATPCGQASCVLAEELATEAERQGLSLRLVALYITVVWLVVMPLGFIAIAAAIAWKRSADWLALLVSFALLVMGAYLLSGVNEVVASRPGWSLINRLLVLSGTSAFFTLLHVFPDGRFAPRRSYALVVAGTLWLLIAPSYPAFLTLLGVGLLAQVYRYRSVSTPLQRQQTKWVVLGFLGVALDVLTYAAVMINPLLPPSARLLFTLISLPLSAIAALLLPLSLAISIFRYRLWDIDLLINRALVYGTLTLLLSLVYIGSVVVLQRLVTNLSGAQESSLVTVISTLGIAALFQPLRRRTQSFIDRRFYRHKYDATRALEAFGARLREEVELPTVSADLLAVIEDTLKPAHVSIWLRDTSPETPAARMKT